MGPAMTGVSRVRCTSRTAARIPQTQDDDPHPRVTMPRQEIGSTSSRLRIMTTKMKSTMMAPA